MCPIVAARREEAAAGSSHPAARLHGLILVDREYKLVVGRINVAVTTFHQSGGVVQYNQFIKTVANKPFNFKQILLLDTITSWFSYIL